MATERFRNFATVVYTESAPDGWLTLIDDLHIPAFVSPLHDRDINPTGEPKKPHYHVLVMFEGPKSQKQARAIFQTFGGVGCEIVNSERGYARYLLHLDNPEKAKYKREDIISFAGADYDNTITLITDVYQVLREILQFCEDKGVNSFRQLTLYAALYNESWFRVITMKCTVFLTAYFRSRTWEQQKYEGNLDIGYLDETQKIEDLSNDVNDSTAVEGV